MKAPWVVRVLLYPEIELGLLNDKGKPDHAKIMGYFAFINFILLAWFGMMPELGIVIVLNASIYGWVGMRTYLNVKKVEKQDARVFQVGRSDEVEETVPSGPSRGD